MVEEYHVQISDSIILYFPLLSPQKWTSIIGTSLERILYSVVFGKRVTKIWGKSEAILNHNHNENISGGNYLLKKMCN